MNDNESAALVLRADEASARAREALFHGRLEEGIAHANEALSCAMKLPQVVRIADNLDLLGDLWQRSGRVEEAQRNHLAALEIYRAHGFDVGVGNVELSLGYLSERTGNMSASREHFTRARDAYARAERHGGVGDALRGLGVVSMTEGNVAEAEALFVAALSSVEAAGIRDTSVLTQKIVYIRLALAELQLRRDPARAASQLAEVVRICEDIGDALGAANAHRVLAGAYERLNDLAGSLRQLRRARRLYEGMGSAYGLAQVWEVESNILQDIGDRATANVALAHGAVEADRAGNVSGAAVMRFRRGRNLVVLGDVTEGFDAMSRALEQVAGTPRAGMVAALRDERATLEELLANGERLTVRLGAAERLLLELLCAMHEHDRLPFLARAVLPLLWRIERPGTHEPDFDSVERRLAVEGLLQIVATPGGAFPQTYAVDATLGEAVRAQTEASRTARILNELTAAWAGTFVSDTRAPVRLRAGVAAAMYLRWAKRFKESFEFLEQVFTIARENGVSQHVLPHLHFSALGAADSDVRQRLEALDASAGEACVAQGVAQGDP